jgi:phosphoribosyl 1,2-cyclic phosphodiesterase
MRITLLGVRGSTPEPDPACARYGGHTSCVAVTGPDDAAPRLVLDAGTGIRNLGRLVGGGAFVGTAVVTHMHWDHMHGLPFAAALNHPDTSVDLCLPVEGGDPRELLRAAMSPPLFPIGPEGLTGHWRFHDVPGSDPLDVGGLRVRSAEVRHKGARTVAVRVDSPICSFGYLPDHVPFDGVSDDLLELLDGVDLLAHDAQFLPGEEQLAHDYGHATTNEAIDFAQRCNARGLLLTHHAPGRTDDQLDRLAHDMRGAPLPVLVARQGDSIDIGEMVAGGP